MEPMQVDDFEEENEDIDQLDSDSEVEVEDDPETTSASVKKGWKKDGKRTPGQTVIPVNRLDNILHADGVTGNLSMSKEASYIVSIATEEFIKRMAQAGHRQMSAERRCTVVYADMSMTAQQYQEFLFLQDTIPHPMPLSEALERREMKEKAIVNTDPAISTTHSMLNFTSFSSSGPNSFISKPKVKSRVTNGKEKVNGSVSAGKKETKPKEKKGRTTESNGDASGSSRASSRANRGTRAAPREEWPDVRPVEPTGHPSGALLSNGASPYRYARQPQWAANTTTMRSDDFVEDPHSRRVEPRYISPPRDEGDGWNGGQYTGPASGFIQPFHRVVPNPGRTIYSQQHP
jgi:DNA polymerase epsilon subunit 4